MSHAPDPPDIEQLAKSALRIFRAHRRRERRLWATPFFGFYDALDTLAPTYRDRKNAPESQFERAETKHDGELHVNSTKRVRQ